MSCNLKKKTWGPNAPLFVLYFKDCVMINYVVGPPSGYLKSFDLPFLFFSFFFPFLFSIFFFVYLSLSLSLSGPFSSGAPGHCPLMPPSRYATAEKQTNKQTTYPQLCLIYLLHFESWSLFPGYHGHVVIETISIHFYFNYMEGHCFYI